jgi:hypothetical protein
LDYRANQRYGLILMRSPWMFFSSFTFNHEKHEMHEKKTTAKDTKGGKKRSDKNLCASCG